MHSADLSTRECRLCGGPLTPRFRTEVLGKYDVQYLECSGCHSLQTETPYWLDEAYGNNSLSNLDTGAAQRNIHNLGACFPISKLFGVRNVIDIGGGDGLLCRLLRDYGMNCFVKDRYATPKYAQGFTEPNFEVPDLIIGFEVLEHFACPRVDLDDLFKFRSRVLLLSTGIYSNQDGSWWYLAPQAGQHVFFYSKKSLELIAEKYQYSMVLSGGFILFVQRASILKKWVAKVLLNRVVCRLSRAFIVLLPTPNVWRDHLLQIEKSGHPDSTKT